MPEIWHIWTNCWQKLQAVLPWTVFEKLMQAQCLTVLPFITFCIKTNLLSDIVSLWLLTLRNQFAVKFLSFSSYTLTNLVHHIPLTNLRQVFFFLSRIMILKLLRKEKGYNKQLVGSMRLNVWSIVKWLWTYPWSWKNPSLNRCKLVVYTDAKFLCIGIFLIVILMNCLQRHWRNVRSLVYRSSSCCHYYLHWPIICLLLIDIESNSLKQASVAFNYI